MLQKSLVLGAWLMLAAPVDVAQDGVSRTVD
ncbi:MAG: hypothetical protein RIR41_544, partial [Pseudomonadota bacterium]